MSALLTNREKIPKPCWGSGILQLLAGCRMFMDHSESSYFWTSLGQNQILLLFVFPGKNTHQKDCDFQTVYLQPALYYNIAHHLAQLVDFYVFYYPAFCLSCNICCCSCEKTHTDSWVWADPIPQRQSLLTITWNSHVHHDRVSKAVKRVGVGEIKAMCLYFGNLRREKATMEGIACYLCKRNPFISLF